MGWPPGLDRCAHCSQYRDECKCYERARERRRQERAEVKRQKEAARSMKLSRPQRRILRHAARSTKAISGRYYRTCESLSRHGLITYYETTECRTCGCEWSGIVFKCGHRNRGRLRIYATVTSAGKLAL